MGEKRPPPPPAPPPQGGMGESTKDNGFLPFYTNLFDRIFIAVVILIAVHLLWLRFIEPIPLPEVIVSLLFALEIFISHPPVELATVISIVIGYVVVRRG